MTTEQRVQAFLARRGLTAEDAAIIAASQARYSMAIGQAEAAPMPHGPYRVWINDPDGPVLYDECKTFARALMAHANCGRPAYIE